MTKAVIFDLWNTLIRVPQDYNPYPRIQRLLELDEEATFREAMRTEWMTRRDMSARDFYGLMCTRFERTLCEDESNDFCSIWEEYLRNVEELPAATDVLATLRDKGVKTAIVTNTVEPSMDVIDRLGLRDRVDVVVGSCECGYLKPDPRIFDVALSRLGTEPEETAMVGDKLRTDILGGLILQMRTIYLEPRYESAEMGDALPVDAVIPNLSDLPNAVLTP
jgi:HAD superfamily hydrolase (TIGR01549 family)